MAILMQSCHILLAVVTCVSSLPTGSPGVCSERYLIDAVDVYVSYDLHSDLFSFEKAPNTFTVAHAKYSNCINSTGFAFLSVSTVSSYTYLQLNSSVQAYAAGLAEGKVTRDLMDMQYHNILSDYCKKQEDGCAAIAKFLQTNVEWIIANVQSHPDDAYWYQVRLFYEQMRGLQDGYNGKPGMIAMEVEDVLGIYLLTIYAELNAIQRAVNPSKPVAHSLGHCSVLIKVIQDQEGVKDVLMAHDTWTDYNSMLRILKRYEFYYRKVPTCSEPVLGHNMTFSSYPGALTSIDDFYVLGSAMVTTETTNDVFTNDLFKKVSPQSVLENVRVTVANRLAEHGSDWCQTFSSHNSGTYNNQWMVIDFKQYDEAHQTILPGFLTVLEQIPGTVHYEDQTSVLLNTTYWASYNMPYYPDIYNVSGYPEMFNKYGDFFSHDLCPRAQIFRRDHSKVKDVESMTKLMRYNDFQHDPLSRCNCTPPYSAVNAISARNDLNLPNGTYPLYYLEFGLWGGTDMKLTSISMAMDTLTFFAISGPTFDPLPPFQWSTAINGNTTKHVGHPDLFKFDSVAFNGGFL